MVYFLLLTTLPSAGILSVYVDKKQQKFPFIIEVLQLLLIGLMVYSFFNPSQLNNFTWELLKFNNISLNFSVQFDALAKGMIIFILLISLFIYHYAINYLESDSTRARFLAQFNLVVASVILLVISANLLTAFIAWQLIGINLYLLLNHYHYDAAANRAAKKKFVINRLGDCSFLLAIIFAYQPHMNDSFASLQANPNAELICMLLFISVMTKCAQFPFHIWLIDTMETPTPVSALMHAGVINAGGILLTRISATLMQFHTVAYVILAVGLTSALLSIHWMNQQPDTKKKLAYSTVGQMGYMLIQCGLGAFSAAIFHLISHGFYKASLFLNAGETLKRQPDEMENSMSFKLFVGSVLIASIIFLTGALFFSNKIQNLPILILGFIFISLLTLVIKTELTLQFSQMYRLVTYLLIIFVYNLYLVLFSLFNHFFNYYDHKAVISEPIQLGVLLVLAISQYFIWKKNLTSLVTTHSAVGIAKSERSGQYKAKGGEHIPSLQIKDKTEYYLRKLLLQPLRSFGNIANHKNYQKPVLFISISIMIFTLFIFSYALVNHSEIRVIASKETYMMIFLAISIIALIIANRCLSIKSLLFYLCIFEIAFINVAFFEGNPSLLKIGIFHFINISAVLIMLALLAKNSNKRLTKETVDNQFPTRVFYLVFGLLLLIGIPGTASFISEFYLFKSLIDYGYLFIFGYGFLIVLTSIVVMHSLQLYAFNKKYVDLLLKPITKKEHFIFLTVIIFNIAFGLWPALLLNTI